MTIAELGEFVLISRLTARLPRGPAVLLGPGDDAAVLRIESARVVATTDLLVEGRHFHRDWSAAYDVGRKAAAQNLADIAAMGAHPVALLVGFAAPGDLPVAWAEELMDGLREESEPLGVSIVGGDVVAAESVMLAVTALGEQAGVGPVTRAGARPSDLVAVTGLLGGAAAGLEALRRGLEDAPQAAVSAHRRPTPPYAAGPEAARHGATAMIDVSDGLVQDLGHIAEASGVRVEVDSARLPLAEAVAATARALDADPLHWVLTGGEDHALAATFPEAAAVPPEWTVIGEVTAGSGVVVDGEAYGDGGWDHFRSPPGPP